MRGSWEEGKRKRAGDNGSPHRSLRAPEFLISPFSLPFPYFLAGFPLKKPLRRREIQSHVAAIPHGTAHGRYGGGERFRATSLPYLMVRRMGAVAEERDSEPRRCHTSWYGAWEIWRLNWA